jgi:hypothetical protein
LREIAKKKKTNFKNKGENIMLNVGADMQMDDFKAVKGIGLYKIQYEMDVKNSARPQNYIAGIIAYSSQEAVDTLVQFAKKRVKGFKGLKIDTVAFEGLCHAMSDTVKGQVINGAINEGKVVDKAKYDADMKIAMEASTKASTVKKSIIPKD